MDEWKGGHFLTECEALWLYLVAQSFQATGSTGQWGREHMWNCVGLRSTGWWFQMGMAGLRLSRWGSSVLQTTH